MFHESQIENVKRRIEEDLYYIEELGSRKLYLCWYDEYLIPSGEFKGIYPCSNKRVDLKEVIDIIKDVIKKPCIIRHNVIGANPIPVFLMDKSDSQQECELYVEICLIV